MEPIDLVILAYLVGAVWFASQTWVEIRATSLVGLHWASLGMASAAVWPLAVIAMFVFVCASSKVVDLAHCRDFLPRRGP